VHWVVLRRGAHGHQVQLADHRRLLRVRSARAGASGARGPRIHRSEVRIRIVVLVEILSNHNKTLSINIEQLVLRHVALADLLVRTL
jgi:hypothetical protein